MSNTVSGPSAGTLDSLSYVSTYSLNLRRLISISRFRRIVLLMSPSPLTTLDDREQRYREESRGIEWERGGGREGFLGIRRSYLVDTVVFGDAVLFVIRQIAQ